MAKKEKITDYKADTKEGKIIIKPIKKKKKRGKK